MTKSGYQSGSYGVYALKDLESGTLLLVEQSFATIDNRVIGKKCDYSINYWQKESKIEYYSNETLRLLNEVEKQLIIGSSTCMKFNKIKFMQPIRQWLKKNIDGNLDYEQDDNDIPSDLLEDYEQTFLNKKQWRQPFFK